MVRVLCYGHKSYKFESYTRLKKKGMNYLLIYIDGMARFAPASLAKQNTHFLVQSKSDAVASRLQETLLRDM